MKKQCELFFVLFIGQASKQFDYNIVTFFQFSKDNEQLTQKQISPLRSNEIFDIQNFFSSGSG